MVSSQVLFNFIFRTYFLAKDIYCYDLVKCMHLDLFTCWFNLSVGCFGSGQPKRHLLTTGWSTFVGAKHLKAGDSVLFVRNEKSQLLLGVRRVDRQQTILASSVLSADSMHIGVLAAAAHAAENRSSFSVFYNPRACRSEFVIPLVKYHKATFKNQVSVGMRFGMMTEESSKCRSMGTIVGIRDSDPLRWPNSNWEKLQVNWDEPSCSQRPSRVSFWEIEVPENHFIFSTPTSGLKRSLYFEYEGSGLGCESKSKKLPSLVLEGRYSNHQNLGSEQLMNMVLKSQTSTSRYQFGCNLTAYSATPKNIANTNLVSPVSTYPSAFSIMGTQRQKDVSLAQKAIEQKHVLHCQQLIPTPQTIFRKDQNHQCSSNSAFMNTKRGQIMEKSSQRPNDKGQDKARSSVNGMHHEKIDAAIAASIGTVSDQSHSTVSTTVQQIFHFPEENSEESFTRDLRSPHDIVGMTPLLETSNLDSLLTCPGQHPYVNNDEVVVHYSDTQSLTSISKSPIVLSCTSKPEASLLSVSAPDRTKSIDGFPIPWSSKGNEPEWPPLAQVLSGSSHENCFSHLPQEEDILEKLFQQNIISSCGFKDYSDASSLHVETSNASIIVDPSVSSTVLEETSPLKESSSIISPDFLLGNFGLSQDVQPYITSGSLSESEAFSHQEVPDIPWKASSSNVNESENNLLHKASLKHVSPPLRTYTKVQKLGCVGRSIDVTRFRNYSELVSAITCMFGLEGKLDDPKGSGWKLVYIDYENDVLLVGDDPWEEFVCCVRCIKILSPAEVQQFES
ncbi:Auxin response factor 5 [Acorus gramineus]|uniref:Auxin response factor n=1 Tax=Acorus gramineus TaxID=55184 RepID=A0AAV9AAT1_ACOGR|nr:Auxin response factor 5 [Acorus gramineus]